MGACIAASALTAIVLHLAAGRSEAWAAVIPAVVWGLAALWGAHRLRADPGTLAGIALAAVLVRAPLIGTPLHLSDDAWRYLWEGAALNAGWNPFVHAPSDLPGVDDALRARVNHPTMTSIYPPLALWWFRLLALAGGAWAAQVGSAAADVVTSVAIGAWRRDRGRSAWPAWLYALHPLPALESASGAHLEPVAIALCVGALWAWNRRRDHAAVALLVAGAGVKLLPLLLVPAIARGRTWITALLALLALAALAWPVWDAGPALLTSARTYAAHWSFNGLLYPVVAPALGAAARPLLVATGAAIVVAAWRYSSGPVGVWTAVGSAFVLLSPTVHPWYVLWALAPSLLAGHWGWAAASVAFLPSYLVLRALDDTGAWVVPPWLPWVTWVPALGALAAEWGFRARPPDAP